MPSYQKRVLLPGKSDLELYEFISTELDRFLKTASLGKFELQRDQKLKTVRVKSSMFSGELKCGDGYLELQGQLSFLAMPFKSKLDDGIEKWLKKSFFQTQC